MAIETPCTSSNYYLEEYNEKEAQNVATNARWMAERNEYVPRWHWNKYSPKKGYKFIGK